MTAIILGNGESRERIPLENLRTVPDIPIYGCNAIYRDYRDWDVLVVLDDGMRAEVMDHDWSDYNLDPDRPQEIYIPSDDEHYENPLFSPNRRRANSGMIAMTHAIARGHDQLFCVGMDFVLDSELETSNIYDGTENYTYETRATKADNLNRIAYMEWFAGMNPKVDFWFVYPENAGRKTLRGKNIKWLKTNCFLYEILAGEECQLKLYGR